MRVAVTGAHGFLGWHLQCAFLARQGHEVVPLGRTEFAAPEMLADALRNCGAVVHLAGVNRGSDEHVQAGNRWLAASLAEALPGSAVRAVVYGNSVHGGSPTAFGQSKAYAADELARAASKTGAAFVDVVLPNIFGEGGRPHYNSVVATFCHELISGNRPPVFDDKELPLLHAQDASDVLVGAVESGQDQTLRPAGRHTLVSEVLHQLEAMLPYAAAGEFPDLSTRFRVALFNTFQSHCFPAAFPLDLQLHTDERGTLFESARARKTDTLSFVSTTAPAAVRGQHFHRRKVERFVVVDGEAEIRLRRMVTGEEISFVVSGERPQAVDMPPLWAHSLKNVGARPVTTVFWSNEWLDPDQPDTFRYAVYG